MPAAPEAKYTEETVLWVQRHTPKLMTFAITRPESYRFAAGQFSRLGCSPHNPQTKFPIRRQCPPYPVIPSNVFPNI